MLKKFMLGTGILIGTYLVLSQARNASTVLNSGGNVYAQGVRTLQGR
jgi:hypothetical protein